MLLGNLVIEIVLFLSISNALFKKFNFQLRTRVANYVMHLFSIACPIILWGCHERTSWIWRPSFIDYLSYFINFRMSTTLIGDSYLRDRFYTYEPRSRPLYDLKYISFGFAYLQDMIETSVIMEQTGRVETPGIILQQFPYPCYIEDQ